MDARPRSRLRNKVAYWLHRAHNRVENESNVDFSTNGEGAFLSSFMRDKVSGPIVIFDVGANIGEYGDIAFNALPDADRQRLSVYSFEPVAEFAGHGTLIKAAVSDTDGTLTMHKRHHDGVSSVHRQEWLDRKHGAPEEVTVPTIRLDTYIEKNGIAHVDLLKIDVEGHELNVLRGCGKYLNPHFIGMIQFEYGLAAKSSGNFFQYFHKLLTSKGYKVYKMYPTHLEEATLDWAESIEYANFVAMG